LGGGTFGGGGGEGGGGGGAFNIADKYGITSDCGMSAISGAASLATGSTMKKRGGTRGGETGGGAEHFHGAASSARCLHENLGEYTPLTMLPQEQDDANVMPLLRIYDISTYFRHFFFPKKGAGSFVEKLRHAIWKPVAGLLWFLGLIAWQVLLGLAISTVALYLINEKNDDGLDSVEQQSYAHEYQASHRNFGVGWEGGRAGREGREEGRKGGRGRGRIRIVTVGSDLLCLRNLW